MLHPVFSPYAVQTKKVIVKMVCRSCEQLALGFLPFQRPKLQNNPMRCDVQEFPCYAICVFLRAKVHETVACDVLGVRFPERSVGDPDGGETLNLPCCNPDPDCHSLRGHRRLQSQFLQTILTITASTAGGWGRGYKAPGCRPPGHVCGNHSLWCWTWPPHASDHLPDMEWEC